jgi:hypothetical protein
MTLCEPGVACALLLMQNEAWVALKDGTLAALGLKEETMLRRVGLHGEAVRKIWSTNKGVVVIDEGGKVSAQILATCSRADATASRSASGPRPAQSQR